MAEPSNDTERERPPTPSAFPSRETGGREAGPKGTADWGTPEWVALALSAIWLVLVGIFWARQPATGTGGGLWASGPLAVILALAGVVLPVVMIWVVAVTLRMIREMHTEARELKAVLAAARGSWLAQSQLNQSPSRRTQPYPRTAEPLAERPLPAASPSRPAELSVAGQSAPAGREDAPSADLADPAQQEDQPALALDDMPEDGVSVPVSVADFVRALNFPDDARDAEGIRALRRALGDRTMAKLIRAAQDVLNLLAQEGIYMDDLTPEGPVRPELWRRFSTGERGAEVGLIGTVRDRSSLALTAGRMRSDAVFRDAVHHFLRQFDRSFSELEKNASDAEIAQLADTRTARAFMLLGRVTGMFD